MHGTIRIGLVAAALAVSGCATPYGDPGLFGGVAVEQLDPVTLRIEGRGNGFTSPETIQNYVFLRAAEETLARGFDYFAVLDGQDISKPRATTLRGQTYSTTTTNQYGFRRTTTTAAPNTVVSFVEPGSAIVVELLDGPMPEPLPDDVFDAVEVVSFLGPRVR